jgi:hypothetical protein
LGWIVSYTQQNIALINTFDPVVAITLKGAVMDSQRASMFYCRLEYGHIFGLVCHECEKPVAWSPDLEVLSWVETLHARVNHMPEQEKETEREIQESAPQ